MMPDKGQPGFGAVSAVMPIPISHKYPEEYNEWRKGLENTGRILVWLVGLGADTRCDIGG
jgi:hypothetical protein